MTLVAMFILRLVLVISCGVIFGTDQPMEEWSPDMTGEWLGILRFLAVGNIFIFIYTTRILRVVYCELWAVSGSHFTRKADIGTCTMYNEYVKFVIRRSKREMVFTLQVSIDAFLHVCCGLGFLNLNKTTDCKIWTYNGGEGLSLKLCFLYYYSPILSRQMSGNAKLRVELVSFCGKNVHLNAACFIIDRSINKIYISFTNFA